MAFPVRCITGSYRRVGSGRSKKLVNTYYRSVVSRCADADGECAAAFVGRPNARNFPLLSRQSPVLPRTGFRRKKLWHLDVAIVNLRPASSKRTRAMNGVGA